jgi:hypothetical protein
MMMLPVLHEIVTMPYYFDNITIFAPLVPIESEKSLPKPPQYSAWFHI